MTSIEIQSTFSKLPETALLSVCCMGYEWLWTSIQVFSTYKEYTNTIISGHYAALILGPAVGWLTSLICTRLPYQDTSQDAETFQKESAQSDHPIQRKRPKHEQILRYFDICPKHLNQTTYSIYLMLSPDCVIGLTWFLLLFAGIFVIAISKNPWVLLFLGKNLYSIDIPLPPCYLYSKETFSTCGSDSLRVEYW
jgi:hypothetical protein